MQIEAFCGFGRPDLTGEFSFFSRPEMKGAHFGNELINILSSLYEMGLHSERVPSSLTFSSHLTSTRITRDHQEPEEGISSSLLRPEEQEAAEERAPSRSSDNDEMSLQFFLAPSLPTKHGCTFILPHAIHWRPRGEQSRAAAPPVSSPQIAFVSSLQLQPRRVLPPPKGRQEESSESSPPFKRATSRMARTKKVCAACSEENEGAVVGVVGEIYAARIIAHLEGEPLAIFADEPEMSAERAVVHGGLGHSAELSCSVYADPPAEVVWYRESMRLDPNGAR